MPKHTEKKFRVKSFDKVTDKLDELEANKLPLSESHHYYAIQDSSDVTKLVISSSKSEIHILKEENGTFTLIDSIRVEGKDDGIDWLNKNGFTKISHIKMVHTDYEFEDGIVGLYIINDDLLSVILDYPTKEHIRMAKLFNIEKSEVIEQPYNKYLQN